MEMMKLAGFALAGALMAMLLRRLRPEAGLAASLGAGVVMSALILPQIGKMISGVLQIADAVGISGAYMSQLLKVCGVSLLMDFSAQTLDNWTSKIANMLEQELDLSEGSTIAVDMPVSWQAAVTVFGALAVIEAFLFT